MQDLISNPAFNHYVYSVMLNSTPEQRMELSNAELAHFKNQATIRKFAHTASFEKQQIMLVKLGMEFVYFVAPGQKDVDDAIFLTYEQYQSEERHLNVIEGMARGAVFAFGSREMQSHIAMCAQNAQTKAYQYSGITKHMVLLRKNWVKNNASQVAIKLNSENAEDAYQKYGAMMRQVITSETNVAKLYDVTMLEMRIMLELYANVNSALRADDIILRLNEESNQKKVLDALDNLMLLKHVNRDATPQKTAPGQYIFYMLNGSGIKKVKSYIALVAEKIG